MNPPRINFDLGSQIGEFWCKLGVFLYSSPKAGLNSVPTVKITLGTPFPAGVLAGNYPWLYEESAKFLPTRHCCEKVRALCCVSPSQKN